MLSATIVKRAEKAGLTLVEQGKGVQALKGKAVLAFHSNANTAVERAMLRMEEDRLRSLDKKASDREPVLKTPKLKMMVNPTPETSDQKVDAGIRKSAKGPVKGNIIKPEYKERYKKHGYSCGDDIADELRAYVVVLVDGHSRVSVERLREVANTNGVWRDNYANLNVGQQRMNIGNRLRAKFNNGERIDIGGAILEKEFKGL